MPSSYQPLFVPVLWAATVALSSAPALSECDGRTAINNTERFPFNTITTLRYDADYDGELSAVGSGVLVTPYTVLTCGHCVYNRSESHYNYADIHVQPGAYLDGSTIIHPYGTRIADHKHTNSKFADLDFTPKGDVDYGVLHIICPFEELDTFMALRFDYEPSNVNMSGYPVESLPDSSRTFDQWRDYDAVTDVQSRRIWYDVRSTGGASGAPDWIYFPDTGERYIVALNRAHSTSCDGIGTRLVWNNEDLIREWMSWEPSFAEKLAAGCAFDRVLIPFDFILDFYAQNPPELIPIQTLNLVDPVFPPPSPPTARIFQVIGNQFYEWEEFRVHPQDPNSPRFLRMISPQQMFLPASAAQALLTASVRWVDEVPAGNNLTMAPVGLPIPLALPIDDDPAGPPDETHDEAGPSEVPPCVGDLDGDGVIGFGDLVRALSTWGPCGQGDCPEDLDGTGDVGFGDVLIILANWGPCPQ